ncbi:MAG: oxidoreductase [Treponema sp. GWB1_62_6]|nr:MAG: oxidoreductase [Treponema sp. GWC1_61_84]OHE71170.1 MAG: oxidoreductase [Treponema sp. GWB1_62_6]
MTGLPEVRFGIIGLGLMGKEFAGAVGRWGHLSDPAAVPVITGICDGNPAAHRWFQDRLPSIRIATTDYRVLLESPDIDAVYCAVPHHLHEEMYSAVIRSGKHLMGEKPFGIDRQANERILAVAAERPDVFVRCASEFPYFPGAQRVYDWVSSGRLGRIIEARSGFNHSSDMDLTKPIHWKRIAALNGAYGCLGDLGIHTQHLPFRMGWKPGKVFGSFSKLVKERPDGAGGMAPCDTWDNATLLCEAEDGLGFAFPLTLETKRMEPGSTNRWFLEVYGMDASVRYTTDDPNAFHFLETRGKEQAWCRMDLGYKSMLPTATGPIFQFGFGDAILQMWGAFMSELYGRPVPFGCFTMEETRLSHALATAALRSAETGAMEPVQAF